MRVLFTFVILCVFPGQGFSQLTQFPLESRWISAVPSGFGPEQGCSEPYQPIYYFFHRDSMRTEMSGVTINKSPLRYRIEGDSLIFYQSNSRQISFSIEEWTSQKMRIAVDTSLSTTLWKLPEYNLDASVDDIRATLKESIWQFSWKGKKPNTELIRFKNTLEDSGIVLPEYHSEVRSFISQQSNYVSEYGAYWSVANHGKNIVLRMEDVMNTSIDIAFVIKKVQQNELSLEYWTCAGKKTITVKKVNLQDSAKIIDLLTNRYWRYNKTLPKKHKKESRSSGMTGRWYNAEKEKEYYRDSSLLIQAADLEKRMLRFKFNLDRSYQIFRNDRIIDSGSWQPLFDYKTIKLKSSRVNSEGILDGFLFVKKISANRLELRRQLRMEFDRAKSYETTSVERYIGEFKE